MNVDVDKIEEKLAGVYAEIERLLETKSAVAVAFDGMSASGKTTAGGVAAKRWGANLVHMDDFFLPTELRTPERLAEPGGNVHYERFLSEAADGIKKGAGFSHRVFDCRVMDYTRTVEFCPSRVAIVEGAYSAHPRFGDLYDLKVFFEADGDTQKQRILERSGEAALEQFISRWIPMENAYFAEYEIREKSGITVKL